MVIAPASTGRDRSSRITVSRIAQINRGTCSSCIPFERILVIVVMKLIAPRIDEAPAKWSEKMAISTDGPL